MNDNNVLICGGSGLVGTKLAGLLRREGYKVMILSRRKNADQAEFYYWDPARDFINPDAILNANIIINVAGAGIADRKWSARRKAEIQNSRVQSTDLIYKKLQELKVRPDLFISASAVGFYGDRGDEVLEEHSSAGQGFLAETALKWERAAMRIHDLGVRTVVFRIGVVLAREGGALSKLAQPVRLYVGAPLGEGTQYVSWIHIDDLCRMFLMAIRNKRLSGIFNAVSPEPVTNGGLTTAIAEELERPLILPAVPEFALRLAMGEMAHVVLDSTRVSSERIQTAGFEFRYAKLTAALSDLLAG